MAWPRHRCSDAAGLRPATAAINRQVLTLAVTLMAALLPTIRSASGGWLVSALGLSGMFAFVLFCMRARWINRVRSAWEGRVQTMLPPAPST